MLLLPIISGRKAGYHVISMRDDFKTIYGPTQLGQDLREQ